MQAKRHARHLGAHLRTRAFIFSLIYELANTPLPTLFSLLRLRVRKEQSITPCVRHLRVTLMFFFRGGHPSCGKKENLCRDRPRICVSCRFLIATMLKREIVQLLLTPHVEANRLLRVTTLATINLYFFSCN